MTPRSVVALSGGVGGARFAAGLCAALPPDTLTVIVNTGDDFRHWGLSICPDLDTVLYTLAGLSDDERGWGLRGETFQALEAMRRLTGDEWFALGDRDLATHLQRTTALTSGKPLSAVTRDLCAALGVRATLLPMSDSPCPTFIETAAEGTLPFQEWFVKHRAPAVRRVDLRGPGPAAPGVLEAIRGADVVLIGPSNPYVSIDPILTREGVSEALRGKVVVAVSPLLGGKAVKGPLAEMIPALSGLPPSANAILRHYGSLLPKLAGFVVERGDERDIPEESGVKTLATSTLMLTQEDRTRLAREVLAFGETLA